MKFLCPIFLLFLFLISCGRKTLISEGEMGGITYLSGGALKIKISSALVGAPDEYVLQEEKTFTGTSINDGNHQLDLSMDEAVLHYSRLKFEIEKTGESNDCEVIFFAPYTYKKSSASAYKATLFGEELNCSGVEPGPPPVPKEIPKECYGGPAKDIVPGFPLFGSIFTTQNKLEALGKFTNEENTKDPRIDNRYYVNNMLEVDRDTGQPMYYVANTMSDYSVYCRDAFGNKLVDVQININDFDGASPNPDVDQYCTWTSGTCGIE